MKILGVLSLVTVGWDLGWWAAGVRPMPPWRVDGLEDPWVVDVRTEREFAWRRLPDAESFSLGRGLAEAAALHPKGRPVLVVCFTGHRSALIARQLKQAGFEQVYNLTEGLAAYLAWQALSRSSERPPPRQARARRLGH